MIYLLLLILGVVAGLRVVTPLAALSIGAYLGWIDLTGTWAGFAGNIITVAMLVIAALIEFVTDQLPTIPSRKTPGQFGVRIVMGGLAGSILGLVGGGWVVGLVLGAIGAVLGTLGGFEARRALAKAFGRDLPAALVEDAVGVVIALVVAYLA